MTEYVFTAVSAEGLEAVAEKVVEHIDRYKVWIFHGEMGSGKTTLIKEICRKLNVSDVMSSPTFSIVNEYATTGHGKVFHFDFYRIRHEAEAFDIGTDEYFYSDYPCFVEWPEKIPSLIPSAHGVVSVTITSKTERTIAISLHD
ncbi:tRNA (adenosine(37)-N6)-threonylcarbamoyltransferase complex ATPase subunit type 1 TsaE [Pseudochryseolinea flava]|uniref:tRNA threonylcarbamoyladenosine biosynthesis protein TsaE n=2 Tax=Pseudochryseolinea flava TaxID=2059302 RepID=A0A364XWS7_9BACT|nr:tRNA (adenosine(37)-N6)-threonylcarbamoyltransferase complex ATPase subunit type 1 TsaE [Pseudochryseolinea flava]